MIRLLRFDFRRASRNKILYLCAVALFGLAFSGVLSHFYYSTVVGEPGYSTPSGLYLLDMRFFAVVCAVFSGMFIGTEFQDKTIRNKIIIGHSKLKIYLSYFTVTTAALLLLHILYAVSIIGFAAILLENFKELPKDYFASLLCSLVTVVALNALTVMFTMMIQNKAYGAVFCILIALGLILAGMGIAGALENPKTIGGFEFESNGEIIKVPERENPYYVGGALRVIYTFLNDFLPGGQAFWLSQSLDLPEGFLTMPLYATIFAIATTLIGIWCFKKRDMK